MHTVKPEFFVLAQTSVDYDQLNAMLEAVGMDSQQAGMYVEDNKHTEQRCSPGETLVEVGGRLCYKSFAPGLNPNVTKVREGNQTYIKNILSSKHGSVLEHATASVAFIGVTRVFTHEIVRHRAGCAFSQESLRYVRLEDIGYRDPDVLRDHDLLHRVFVALGHDTNPALSEELWRNAIEGAVDENFRNAINTAEIAYSNLSQTFEIDRIKDFELKKALTSAFRRVAPIGLATNILMTANHRAWRHIFEMRTGKGVVEEEVHNVITALGMNFSHAFPNFYQDMSWDYDRSKWQFANSKI